MVEMTWKRTSGPSAPPKPKSSSPSMSRDVMSSLPRTFSACSAPDPRHATIRNLLRKGWLSRIIGGRYMLLPPEHGPTLLYRVVVSRFPAWLHHTKADDRFRRCAQTGSGARDRRPCCPLHQAHIAKILRLPDLRRLRPPAAISTPAKTLIDCLDRPDLCGGATELACITHAAFRRLTRTKFSKPHSG
jgi:hypothetical protein